MEMDADPGAAVSVAVLKKICGRSALYQQVFDNTFAVFGALKETVHEMASELDEQLEALGHETKIEYRDRGKFEAQLQVADDILIFSMHSNVFAFDRDHLVWQNAYVQQHRENGYFGTINIYNFLTDSFKYNRSADEGYLIGRVFLNREKCYFVEGKRQEVMRCERFGTAPITRDALRGIIESSIDYVLDFDLLVPPYEIVKVVTVDQMNTKVENSKMQTGKRLGYRFDTDDI